jgi:hypothetical protein
MLHCCQKLTNFNEGNMESQHIVELLLSMKARMNTNKDVLLKTMKGIMDANAKSMRQEIIYAQAKIRSTVNVFKEKMDASIANRTIVRKEMTACQYAMETSLKNMESNPGEEKTAVRQHEIPKEKVAVPFQKTCRSETGTSQEDTETKPDPGKMQSVEDHLEISKEEAAVMPVGEPRKRNERTRGNCESRRKLAAACRKVSCHAKVAWCKRNLVRRIETQINYGPRKRLNITGRKTTSRATVAWHSKNVVRKDCARDQAKRGTPKRRKDGEGLWKFPESNNGLRNQGLSQQLCSKTRIKDPHTRQQLRLANERTTSMFYRKTIRLEIVKQVLRILSVFRKTRKWIL